MRFSAVLFVLGSLVSMAGAQSWEADNRAQQGPTMARAALEGMSPNERENSLISLEFETSDGAAVALGCEVERFWNDGAYNEALVRLGELEARVGPVAVGNSWRRPVPTVETRLWGRDVRIGNRDSLRELAFDADDSTSNLLVALRHGSGIPHFSICMSVDTGASWKETFTWSGSPTPSLDAAIAASHLYVAYCSPGENAAQIRLRRFLCSTGRADTFRDGGSWIAACTMDVGDTLKEVTLVSTRYYSYYYRQFMTALLSDGSITWSWSDEDGTSWVSRPTGITSGAYSGLDATANEDGDSTDQFFSYHDTHDTLRIYSWGFGGFRRRLSQFTGRGTPTSIAAHTDTIICAYEDETATPHQVRCAVNIGDSATWVVDRLSDAGVEAESPGATVRGGKVAAVFRHCSPTRELHLRQRTYGEPWGAPVSIADHEPYWGRPEARYLDPAGLLGVAYLSNVVPVVRGAYFDRSDWVYGIAEESRPQVSSHKMQATVVSGVLFLQEVSSLKPQAARLIDASGRTARELHAGANDLRSLAPGVYFVREESHTPSPGPQAVRKVVVMR